MRVLVLGGTLFASAALVAAGGCQPSAAVTVVHLGPGDKTDAVRGDTVKTRRGGQEAFVGLRGGFHVVRNVEDWRSAWPSGKEPPLPSTLEPARSMLILAVAESKETVALAITNVLESGDRVDVWVKETRAGDNCRPRGERTPFDAVVAPRIDKPVRFYVEEARAESCGEAPAVAVKCRANDAPKWSEAVVAQPGDAVECEMSAETRGKFALIDSVLSLGELPGGSSAKLAYTRGPRRGTFAVDVFGTYAVRGEATDESGRRSVATATVTAVPPKTRDVLVQLVWTNFDVSDDPDTFPRVKLRAYDEGTGAKNKPVRNVCSYDDPRPAFCDVKTRSAYSHMRLKAGTTPVPLEVLYVDERVEKGPLVCVQLYFDGARTGETCDRVHRNADDRWSIGVVDRESGKLVEPGSDAADAGAPDADADAGPTGAGVGITKPLPPRIPAPKPRPPVPPAPRR
jgi:hypothetical protein